MLAVSRAGRVADRWVGPGASPCRAGQVVGHQDAGGRLGFLARALAVGLGGWQEAG